MGFLPASGMLWQLFASLMHLFEVFEVPVRADAAAAAPVPYAAGLPMILCELAPLNQQFLALLTARKLSDWPAAYQRSVLGTISVPNTIGILLMWQGAALRLAAKLIEEHEERAQAAGGAGGTDRTDREQQQQGQGLPAMSNEDLLTSSAVTQLAASPALWAAAWAQLAAFCQGMYTWQGGKLKKALPSSSSTRGNSSSSSSSIKAGSSDFARMFAALQLSPDHEQVAAVFQPGEISARIELLSLPAKGRPFSETALASVLRRGFTASVSFLDSALTFHGPSVLCEGRSSQEGGSGSKGNGSGSSSGGGGGGAGRSSSSSAHTGAGEGISSTSTGSGSGEVSSCSSGRIWSSSRGGVAPAAALQLVLEAAVLLGVVGRPRESSAAVMLVCTVAKNCSIGPRKCLLATRGALVLDVLTAPARAYPDSFISVAQNLVYIFLSGAGEGAWGLGWNQQSARALQQSLGLAQVLMDAWQLIQHVLQFISVQRAAFIF